MNQIRKIALIVAGASVALLLLGATPNNGYEARHEANNWAEMGEIVRSERTTSPEYGQVWLVEGTDSTVIMDEEFNQ